MIYSQKWPKKWRGRRSKGGSATRRNVIRFMNQMMSMRNVEAEACWRCAIDTQGSVYYSQMALDL